MAAAPDRSVAQQAVFDSILERQLRIARAPNGGYRVIEIHVIDPAPAGERLEATGPLPIIQLPPNASEVTGLGGDVEASRVMHSPPHVQLLRPLPERAYRFGLSYRLPPGSDRLTLQAELPVRTLMVLIDRGTIEAELDAALVAEGDAGSPDRPVAVYRASALPPGEEIVVRLGSTSIGWRERIAVLAAAGLACAVAAWAVWRLDRAPQPPAQHPVAGRGARF